MEKLYNYSTTIKFIISTAFKMYAWKNFKRQKTVKWYKVK